MSDQTHYETCWKDPRHHECALRRIAELEARWIPVEERLPEERERVLVWGTDYSLPSAPRVHVSYCARWAVDWSQREERFGLPTGVTHWMPLPEPPK